MSASDDIQKKHNIDLPEEKIDDDGGEGTISGSAPEPESDDSIDEATRKAGIYEGEEIKQVDVAKEIDKDQKGLKDIPPPKK